MQCFRCTAKDSNDTWDYAPLYLTKKEVNSIAQWALDSEDTESSSISYVFDSDISSLMTTSCTAVDEATEEQQNVANLTSSSITDPLNTENPSFKTPVTTTPTCLPLEIFIDASTDLAHSRQNTRHKMTSRRLRRQKQIDPVSGRSTSDSSEFDGEHLVAETELVEKPLGSKQQRSYREYVKDKRSRSRDTDPNRPSKMRRSQTEPLDTPGDDVIVANSEEEEEMDSGQAWKQVHWKVHRMPQSARNRDSEQGGGESITVKTDKSKQQESQNAKRSKTIDLATLPLVDADADAVQDAKMIVFDNLETYLPTGTQHRSMHEKKKMVEFSSPEASVLRKSTRDRINSSRQHTEPLPSMFSNSLAPYKRHSSQSPFKLSEHSAFKPIKSNSPSASSSMVDQPIYEQPKPSPAVRKSLNLGDKSPVTPQRSTHSSPAQRTPNFESYQVGRQRDDLEDEPIYVQPSMVRQHEPVEIKEKRVQQPEMRRADAYPLAFASMPAASVEDKRLSYNSQRSSRSSGLEDMSPADKINQVLHRSMQKSGFGSPEFDFGPAVAPTPSDRMADYVSNISAAKAVKAIKPSSQKLQHRHTMADDHDSDNLKRWKAQKFEKQLERQKSVENPTNRTESQEFRTAHLPSGKPIERLNKEEPFYPKAFMSATTSLTAQRAVEENDTKSMKSVTKGSNIIYPSMSVRPAQILSVKAVEKVPESKAKTPERSPDQKPIPKSIPERVKLALKLGDKENSSTKDVMKPSEKLKAALMTSSTPVISEMKDPVPVIHETRHEKPKLVIIEAKPRQLSSSDVETKPLPKERNKSPSLDRSNIGNKEVNEVMAVQVKADNESDIDESSPVKKTFSQIRVASVPSATSASATFTTGNHGVEKKLSDEPKPNTSPTKITDNEQTMQKIPSSILTHTRVVLANSEYVPESDTQPVTIKATILTDPMKSGDEQSQPESPNSENEPSVTSIKMDTRRDLNANMVADTAPMSQLRESSQSLGGHLQADANKKSIMGNALTQYNEYTPSSNEPPQVAGFTRRATGQPISASVAPVTMIGFKSFGTGEAGSDKEPSGVVFAEDIVAGQNVTRKARLFEGLLRKKKEPVAEGRERSPMKQVGFGPKITRAHTVQVPAGDGSYRDSMSPPRRSTHAQHYQQPSNTVNFASLDDVVNESISYPSFAARKSPPKVVTMVDGHTWIQHSPRLSQTRQISPGTTLTRLPRPKTFHETTESYQHPPDPTPTSPVTPPEPKSNGMRYVFSKLHKPARPHSLYDDSYNPPVEGTPEREEIPVIVEKPEPKTVKSPPGDKEPEPFKMTITEKTKFFEHKLNPLRRNVESSFKRRSRRDMGRYQTQPVTPEELSNARIYQRTGVLQDIDDTGVDASSNPKIHDLRKQFEASRETSLPFHRSGENLSNFEETRRRERSVPAARTPLEQITPPLAKEDPSPARPRSFVIDADIPDSAAVIARVGQTLYTMPNPRKPDPKKLVRPRKRVELHLDEDGNEKESKAPAKPHSPEQVPKSTIRIPETIINVSAANDSSQQGSHKEPLSSNNQVQEGYCTVLNLNSGEVKISPTSSNSTLPTSPKGWKPQQKVEKAESAISTTTTTYPPVSAYIEAPFDPALAPARYAPIRIQPPTHQVTLSLTSQSVVNPPATTPPSPLTSYQSRSKTQPIRDVEIEQAMLVGISTGSTIGDRMAALKHNGQEQWKKKIEDDKEQSPAVVMRAKENVPTSQTQRTSVADRMQALRHSSNQWQTRIESKDAEAMTVAAKLEKAGNVASPLSKAISGTPGSAGMKARTPSAVVFKANIDPKLPSPEEGSKTTPVKRLLFPSPKASTEPTALDTGLESFYTSTLAINSNSSKNQGGSRVDARAFLEIAASAETLPSVSKKVKPPRKKASSQNPVKTLASRQDLRTEPSPSMDFVDSPAYEMGRKIQQSRRSHLSVDALAGLASTEDFSAVQLKKGDLTTIPGAATQEKPFTELMLVQFKGKKFIQTRLVEPHISSLNNGDSFVLMSMQKLFVYLGRFSNVLEKAKAKEFANSVERKKEFGRKNIELVEVYDEGADNNSSYQFKEFWKLLSGTLSDVRACNSADEDEIYETMINATNKVYRVVDDVELEPVFDFWGKALKYEMLNADDVFVFDFGTECYIWHGRSVSMEDRKFTVKIAHEMFMTGFDYTECDINPVRPVVNLSGQSVSSPAEWAGSSRPIWTIFGRVTQLMENLLFQAKFCDWPATSQLTRLMNGTTKSDEKKSRIIKKPKLQNTTEVDEIDVDDMFDVEREVVNLILENNNLGRGGIIIDPTEVKRSKFKVITQDLKVWKIEDSEQIDVDLCDYGQFYSNHTYVIRWKYVLSVTGLHRLDGRKSADSVTGRTCICTFFWQGANASVSEQGSCALSSVTKNQDRNPTCRIMQGEEHPAFLRLFNGETVIYCGSPNNVAKNRLFLVVGSFEEEGTLVEIPMKCENIRSQSSYVVLSMQNRLVYLWHGNDTSQSVAVIAQNSAELLANRFDLSKVVEFDEGDEPSTFIQLFDHSRPAISSFDFPRLNSVLTNSDTDLETTRIYKINYATGFLKAIDVPSIYYTPSCYVPFAYRQEDLYEVSQPSLFLIDVGRIIYLWHGWIVEHDEDMMIDGQERETAKVHLGKSFKPTLQTLLHFRNRCRKLRSNDKIEAFVIYAGLEPTEFKSLFPIWVEIDEARKQNLEEGHTQGAMLDVESMLSDLQSKRFSIEELKNKNIPEGIDPTRLEDYIDDDAFESLFGISRMEYENLPRWKQLQLKRTSQLF